MWTASAREGGAACISSDRITDAQALLIGTASINCRIVGLPMARLFTYDGQRVKPHVHGAGNDTMKQLFYGWAVTERPPHFLREWRKFRRMTQQEVADQIGTSKTVISEMERGNLQLSPKWLLRIAPVLRTQAGYIIDHDPEELDSDIIDIWGKIDERDREQAARVLRSFVRTGTND